MDPEHPAGGKIAEHRGGLHLLFLLSGVTAD
jgi:hypothetical protein